MSEINLNHLNHLNNLNCRIAEDLMPLYSEGLCNPESQEFMKAHLATCENCRNLLEQMPIPEAVPEAVQEAVPDETKSFFRIHRKFRRNKLQIIFLSILSGALLLGGGYLSYGQTKKVPGIQSFETIWQNIEAKQLAKSIANGDFESYFDLISRAETGNYGLSAESEILEHLKAESKQTYQDAFGSTKPETIKIRTEYEETNLATESIPVTNIMITYQDGQELDLYYIRNLDGNFMMHPEYPFSKAGTDNFDFQNCLYYINNQQNDMMIRLTENVFLNSDRFETEKYQKLLDIITEIAIAPDYQESFRENILEFRQQGYSFISWHFSRLQYDAELKLLYYSVTITAKDAQGSAVLLTRIYSDYNGMIPPMQSMGEVKTDNCSEELREALLKLFS